MTTALDAVTIDELCHTLGLRPPVGLRIDPPSERVASVAALNDEQLCALQVLAQPDAIAVVTRRSVGVSFVIATRGAWVAEHVIEGTAHHLYARDAINAPTLLLERTGFSHGAAVQAAPIDITVGGYRRMTELLDACDRRRAEAALLAEGAAPSSADALIAAELAGRVEVIGLANDGRRYVGCELSLVGDATTGRWHVPSDATTSLSLRTLLEPASTDDLLDDLSLIFGDPVDTTHLI
jgi:hypothetical protein